MKSNNADLSLVDETATTGLRRAGATADLTADSGSLSDSDSAQPWNVDDAPESELPIPAGELLGGRYLVERMFAEGGMGIVCLGRHAQLDQPVAIKFLRRALSGRASVVQRFLNEARALAALRSEHVVRVMDVGQLGSGRPYFVMEYLDGIDLDALVDRDGPLSVETALSYALQVCEPLAEAHALGIVHRDIKPENLFLWSGGPAKDIVKVLDFGLAKQLGSAKAHGMTGPQDSIGSPCYMSPEQVVTPHLVDARTDIWSVGVVLYRLLSDTLPFDGASLLEVLSHVLNAAPKSLREVMPNLDPELDAIVMRCLEKSADARYQRISELSAALEAYLAKRLAGQTGAASESLAQPASLARPLPSDDDTKLRIPGVHARWPGFLAVLVALIAAATYQADRTGHLRVRRLTEGWLTPARLSVDAPLRARGVEDALLPLQLRGVLASDPVRDDSGAVTLAAVREPERDPESAAAPEPDVTAISDAERAHRADVYREYLRSQGLTPLSEVPLASGPAAGTPATTE